MHHLSWTVVFSSGGVLLSPLPLCTAGMLLLCRLHLGSARGDLNAIGLLNTPRTHALDLHAWLVESRQMDYFSLTVL